MLELEKSILKLNSELNEKKKKVQSNYLAHKLKSENFELQLEKTKKEKKNALQTEIILENENAALEDSKISNELIGEKIEHGKNMKLRHSEGIDLKGKEKSAEEKIKLSEKLTEGKINVGKNEMMNELNNVMLCIDEREKGSKRISPQEKESEVLDARNLKNEKEQRKCSISASQKGLLNIPNKVLNSGTSLTDILAVGDGDVGSMCGSEYIKKRSKIQRNVSLRSEQNESDGEAKGKEKKTPNEKKEEKETGKDRSKEDIDDKRISWREEKALIKFQNENTNDAGIQNTKNSSKKERNKTNSLLLESLSGVTALNSIDGNGGESVNGSNLCDMHENEMRHQTDLGTNDVVVKSSILEGVTDGIAAMESTDNAIELGVNSGGNESSSRALTHPVVTDEAVEIGEHGMDRGGAYDGNERYKSGDGDGDGLEERKRRDKTETEAETDSDNDNDSDEEVRCILYVSILSGYLALHFTHSLIHKYTHACTHTFTQ